MTVQQLMAALKKMPPRATVGVIAHDQDAGAGEYDGEPTSVEKAPDALRERGIDVAIYL